LISLRELIAEDLAVGLMIWYRNGIRANLRGRRIGGANGGEVR
jgi:hypothetical protein